MGRAQRDAVPYTAFTRSVPFLDSASRPAAGLVAAHTIYWLASTINPALAEAEPERIAADRAAFVALLQAVLTLGHQPRVVLLSSGGTVYDPAAAPPYHEGSPTVPRGAYGWAKLDLEWLLAHAGLAPGQAVALRVANAYGPGQPARGGQGVVAHWLRAAARGESITIIGDPASTRDYVYVDDIVDAMLAVHGAGPATPPIVNVGSGQPTSLGALARLIREVTGEPGEIEEHPARGFDVAHTWLDIGLAARALGWRPRTPLRDGLRAAWLAQGADPTPRQPTVPRRPPTLHR
jgi:UDP-glucose 4-epimerase